MNPDLITLLMYISAIGVFTFVAVIVAEAWGEICRWVRLRRRCRYRVLYDVPAEPGRTVWLRGTSGALCFFVDGEGLGLKRGDRVYIEDEGRLSAAGSLSPKDAALLDGATTDNPNTLPVRR